MSRVLVVEDEAHLAEGLRFNLEAEGYQVHVVDSGEEALSSLLNQPPAFDVVVLDVMLPGKDGFDVMSELRQAGQYIPTLMLTARGHPDDILRGFTAGADDYLTKPFELAILIARLQGLLRRRRWLEGELTSGAVAVTQPQADVYRFGKDGQKELNFDLLELKNGARAFRLTLMESNLLRYLIDREGKAVSRKSMLEEVWDLRDNTDTRAIDNFIVRLRKYIEDNPGSPKHLVTVRGIGYRFVANP